MTDEIGEGFDEYGCLWGAVRGHKTVGLSISAALILLSLIRFSMEGSLTTEVWAYLLLTPLPMAIALAPNSQVEHIGVAVVESWGEDDVEGVASEVPDPIEAGFDVPVL